MERFEIRLRPDAAQRFRQLDLFERQEVGDLFDEWRIGRGFDEDFGEADLQGRWQSTIIVGNTAVSFSIDRGARIVSVVSISSADR